jgi:peptide deformylase
VINLCCAELREQEGFWMNKAISISATQVGFPDTPLIVMCSPENWGNYRLQYKNFTSFINPEITASSDEKVTAWEGCPSSDFLYLIERPMQVKARFHDIQGESTESLMKGLLARAFQHEIDHLNGTPCWHEDVKVIDKIAVADIDTEFVADN